MVHIYMHVMRDGKLLTFQSVITPVCDMIGQVSHRNTAARKQLQGSGIEHISCQNHAVPWEYFLL